MEKKYYRSLEERSAIIAGIQQEQMAGDKKFIMESQQEVKSSNNSRRDFLKAFGFTIASAAIAVSCEQPVRKAIPYLIKPEQITPGKASYFASSYFDGIDYSSVIVKVRDGRPIKIEGNTLSKITHGGTNARAQASVLNLYDNSRYQNPIHNGDEITWEQADERIIAQLDAIRQNKGRIVILSPTIISPSTSESIAEFMLAYPGTEHVQYDVLSAAGMLKANEISFGRPFIPAYRFDRANLIVSFDADFLGTWLSPVEYTRQYVSKRRLTDGERQMSQHIQFEGAMSLTGSNADRRIQIRPSHQKSTLAALLNEVRRQLGLTVETSPAATNEVSEVAASLVAQKGNALVVSGSNDTHEQLMVNTINQLLDSYGNTIDTEIHLKVRKADDASMDALVSDMAAGKVAGLIMYDVNPAYDYPDKTKFEEGLQKTGLTVSLSIFTDETSALARFICPDHHYLEAWNDFEIKTGSYSLAQPAIRHIFNTRQAQESLLAWSGKATDFRSFIQNYWERNVYSKSSGYTSFTEFWNSKVHDGVFETTEKEPVARYSEQGLETALATVSPRNTESLELVLYANVAVGSGKHANNPWLQELPDPVSKACWGNYAAISPRLAEELKLKNDQLVSINGLPGLPVLIQPGQEYKTVAISLGYGRSNTGVPANGVGVNLFSQVTSSGETRIFTSSDVTLQPLKGTQALALTQTHHSMEGRPIIKEASLKEYLENPNAGNEDRAYIQSHLKSMYPKVVYDGFHWGMAIDLNLCTGCNACVVACNAENNIPVVGREQVVRAREMHWLRIDRYYNGDINNPEVVRQPVMCQHCDNAPCENVCPVAATTHSNEGLNQMAYNRCIGTRYCNNNCPYKVRRFNFYDYTGADALRGNRYDPAEMTTDLRRLVLNPDVTIRAKGVIEKCSFCVQRIQDKKLEAKTEDRQLTDGEVSPACAQACPAGAIIFGNLNDKNSKVSKWYADERNYHLLEELHTLPSVGYLTKIKNNA